MRFLVSALLAVASTFRPLRCASRLPSPINSIRHIKYLLRFSDFRSLAESQANSAIMLTGQSTRATCPMPRCYMPVFTSVCGHSNRSIAFSTIFLKPFIYPTEHRYIPCSPCPGLGNSFNSFFNIINGLSIQSLPWFYVLFIVPVQQVSLQLLSQCGHPFHTSGHFEYFV